MNKAQKLMASLGVLVLGTLKGDTREKHYRKKGPGRKHFERPAVVFANELRRKVRTTCAAAALAWGDWYRSGDLPNWVGVRGRLTRLCSLDGRPAVQVVVRGDKVRIK